MREIEIEEYRNSKEVGEMVFVREGIIAAETKKFETKNLPYDTNDFAVRGGQIIFCRNFF